MSSVLQEQIFTNARVVLREAVFEGAVVVTEGRIREIGPASRAGEDMGGDYLLPGLVELHTDHMEGHYAPRPGVRWNPLATVQAHDAQVATSGITTVLDALRIGLNDDSGMVAGDFVDLGRAIHTATDEERLRADHYIHLRCEVSAPDCLESFEPFALDARVRLASLMDHSPGQRQFASLETYRNYYQRKQRMSDADFEAFSSRRCRESATYAAPNRMVIAKACAERGIAIASHDDATLAHVDDARAHGVRIAEFPTTHEAAAASHAAGMSVLMGAPNVVRGGSHSGNISARKLASEGLLDILSSDYVPFSLIQAVFALAGNQGGIALPEAVALVSVRPAEAAGFADRGELAVGKRADFVRVKLAQEVPIVAAVWREGRRVA